MEKIKRILYSYFWDVYDNIGFVFILTFLWFVLSIPWFVISFPLLSYGLYSVKINLFISVFFFLMSLLLVYINPVTVALNDVLYLVKKKQEVKIKDFFVSLKRNFLKGMLLFLINVLVSVIFISNIYFYMNLKGKAMYFGIIMSGIYIWVLFFYVAVNLILFPFFVKFKNTGLKQIYFKSFLIMLDNVWIIVVSAFYLFSVIFGCLFFCSMIINVLTGNISIMKTVLQSMSILLFFIFVLSGFWSMFSISLFDEIIKKYFPEKEDEPGETKRGLRELIKPWEM